MRRFLSPHSIISGILAASILGVPHLTARETPPPPPTAITMDDNRELHLHIPTDLQRRYRVDVSGELASWEEHYLSPFKERGAGLVVRQVGEYSPVREFYKVSVLPWIFRPVDVSGDWTGSHAIVRRSDGRAAFIYQNRETNELFYGLRPETDGNPVVVERVVGTGVEDYPDWWDNSGYSDVNLMLDAADAPRIVAMDDHADELVLLRKPAGAQQWERSVIRADFQTPFWVFAKATITPQGMLAVVYRGDDGTYLATADAAAVVPVWQHRRITAAQASGAASMGIVSNDDGELFVQAAGFMRMDAVTGEITPFSGMGQLQCRRGADGSLFQITLGTDGTAIRRSTDGGETWQDDYAERMAYGDGPALTIDADAAGRLSLMRAPAIYRKLTADGPWQRTVLRAAGPHTTDAAGKIQALLTEYDDGVSLVLED